MTKRGPNKLELLFLVVECELSVTCFDKDIDTFATKFHKKPHLEG